MKKRNIKTETMDRQSNTRTGDILEVKGRNSRDTLFF